MRELWPLVAYARLTQRTTKQSRFFRHKYCPAATKVQGRGEQAQSQGSPPRPNTASSSSFPPSPPHSTTCPTPSPPSIATSYPTPPPYQPHSLNPPHSILCLELQHQPSCVFPISTLLMSCHQPRSESFLPYPWKLLYLLLQLTQDPYYHHPVMPVSLCLPLQLLN